MRDTMQDTITAIPAADRIGLRVPWTGAAVVLRGFPSARAQQEPEQAGVEQGNYNIKQSIEFGGRFVDVSGDAQSYDTFVNLQQGPRLLGFTTEMRSLDHHGALFRPPVLQQLRLRR